MSFGNRCDNCGSYFDEVGFCGACGSEKGKQKGIAILLIAVTPVPPICVGCVDWSGCQGEEVMNSGLPKQCVFCENLEGCSLASSLIGVFN